MTFILEDHSDKKTIEDIMKTTIGRTALAVTFALSCAQQVWAETTPADTQANKEMHARMGEIKKEKDFHKMIDDSTEVYRSIAMGKQGAISANILKNVRCIAVLPDVVTGALIVGGTHGDG